MNACKVDSGHTDLGGDVPLNKSLHKKLALKLIHKLLNQTTNVYVVEYGTNIQYGTTT